MSKDEWIQLWLLNELVVEPCQLERPIYQPFSDLAPPWLFPKETITTSTVSDRVKAALTCVRSGLVHLYSKQWQDSLEIENALPTTPLELAGDSEEHLQSAVAVITKSGHDKWEADFQPDWSRYWHTDYVSDDEESGEVTFELYYAGDQILEELKNWYPVYGGFDWPVGIRHYFDPCVKVTSWKILECGKRIRWTGISRSTIECNRVSAESSKSPDIAAELGTTFLSQMKEQMRQQQEARRILRRFSKRWLVDPFEPDLRP